MEPIAYIYNDYKEKFGVPRQSGRVSGTLSKIVFESKYRLDGALDGLEEFNYIWLIFDFSKTHITEFKPKVRPPRLGGNKKIGVFASRSPYRPNSIGLSSVKLEAIEEDKTCGKVLIVSGADLIDGTPIYDIKPYLPYTDCHTDAKGSYSEEYKEHKITVEDKENVLSVLSDEKKSAILSCIAEDPVPSYKNDSEKIYGISFAGYNIRFTKNENTAFILSCKKET